eukprot:CCRYP_007534-RD/>CCRYP_007534-RD protein AED:0.01 eAED:0.01 QI:3543/1/1/1/0.66/0.25/4/1519/165
MDTIDVLALSNLLQPSDEVKPSRNAAPSVLNPFLTLPGEDKRNLPKQSASSDADTEEKEEPKYQIYYKQIVGAEDVFLARSEKTVFSGDCSHIVVKIYFPGCRRDAIALNVTAYELKVESKENKLTLCLPQKVDEENGRAQWDQNKHILTVSLPVIKPAWMISNV